MSDWTRTERSIKTPRGVIYYGGPCKDNYRNMETYDQPGAHQIVTLQRPAMKAFKAAEERVQAKTSKAFMLDVLPGTNRSCTTQAALYKSDSNRYAAPQITGHTRGLAIDVRQDQSKDKLRMIRTALLNEGWKQVRPDDEPWHYAYFVSI